MKNNTVVLGVIGSDCHAVGNKILDYSLSLAGFNVINIGVLSPQEDFINAAIETGASVILVSSLYGHGEMDCQGMRAKCDEAGLKDIKLYVGGNIVVGKRDFVETEKRFKDMGFDRVYPPGTSVETAITDLREDLGVYVAKFA